MSTYTQWWESKRTSKWLWVFGDDVLCEDVIREVRSTLNVDPLNYFSFHVSQDDESKLWDSIFQLPLLNSPKLVIVREANLLSSGSVSELGSSKSALSGTHLLFSSKDAPDPLDASFKPVKCVIGNSRDLVKWVRRQTPMTESSARVLLDWCNGNLRDVYNICKKLNLMHREDGSVYITESLISKIEDETCSDFAEAVFELDKKRALETSKQLNSQDIGPILWRLDYLLDQVVHVKSPTGSKLGYTVEKAVKPFLSHYSLSRISQNRLYLAIADSYHRQGMSEGILEMLVAVW